MDANTLFLRFEGQLQAWGSSDSKFVFRKTMRAPTKSGVLGLLCAAMGYSREEARMHLEQLNKFKLGVRIDRQGTFLMDYHTVGSKIGLLQASDGEIKKTDKTGEIETLITRREYLSDASFLVVLQGNTERLVEILLEINEAISHPQWTLYLGRKSCPPSIPIFETVKKSYHEERVPLMYFPDLLSALSFIPWCPRFADDPIPRKLDCLVEWYPTESQPEAPLDAQIWYDAACSFTPPVHKARFVLYRSLQIEEDCGLTAGNAKYERFRKIKPWGDDTKTKKEYRDANPRCIVCGAAQVHAHHITYRHSGTPQVKEDLRSLCRLCHDAVTMIEYGEGMGMDRINPEEIRWRDKILQKREEIVLFRSRETLKRRLSGEEE